MTKRVRVLMTGYYGKGNLGDEAILESSLKLLEKCGVSRDSVTVASHKPSETSVIHGVRSIPIRSPLLVIAEICRSTHLFHCGGGYRLSGLPLSYLAIRVILARLLRKKVCFVGIGVEPVKGYFNAVQSKIVFRLADYVSVRDDFSALELFRVSGRSNIFVSADLVMSNTVECSLIERNLGRPVVVVSLLTARNAAKYERIRRFYPAIVNFLIERLGAHVVLVATSSGEGDLDVVREVIEHCGHRTWLEAHPWTSTLFGLASLVGGADFLVGMRLHSLILASLVGTPFAAISRSPKVTAFAKSMGQPIVGDVNSDLDVILEGLERSFRERLSTVKVMNRAVIESRRVIVDDFMRAVAESQLLN